MKSEIPVLYQDKWLLAVDKPAGIASVPDLSGDTSVAERLAALGTKKFPLTAINRLDRNVGGVLLFARTKEAAAFFSGLVSDHERVRKEYFAVVHGVPEEEEGTLQDLLFRDSAKNKTYVVDRMRKGVREASLSYRTVATASTEAGVLSLVSVRLHTGRTHQIRVQFASRRHPLYGDRKYGGEEAPEIALHCARMCLPLPSGETVTLSSPLPTDFPWDSFPASPEDNFPEKDV